MIETSSWTSAGHCGSCRFPCVCPIGLLPSVLDLHLTLLSAGSGTFADGGLSYPGSPIGTFHMERVVGLGHYWKTPYPPELGPVHYLWCDGSFAGGQYKFCTNQSIGGLPSCVSIPSPKTCCPDFNWLDNLPFTVTDPSSMWSGTWRIDSVDAYCGNGWYCVSTYEDNPDYDPEDPESQPFIYGPSSCMLFDVPPDPSLWAAWYGPVANESDCSDLCCQPDFLCGYYCVATDPEAEVGDECSYFTTAPDPMTWPNVLGGPFASGDCAGCTGMPFAQGHTVENLKHRLRRKACNCGKQANFNIDRKRGNIPNQSRP